MDTKELNRAWIEVDVAAIQRNVTRLVKRAGVPIIAMLKADAYGIGAVVVARALQQVPDVWAIGVATLAEGMVLRDAGIELRLFCCTPVLREELAAMHATRITPSLFREDDVRTWAALGERAKPSAWHLLIDTGLNRAGVQWYDAATLRDTIAAHPPEGAFTHFYATELQEPSRAIQAERFHAAVEACAVKRANPKVLLHAENSLAIAARPSFASTSPYQLARPGIALHGWPESSDIGLEPVVTLRARVVDTRTVAKGESVSYGATWTTDSEATVATISIGYADGYRRAFSNAAAVVINGTRCPVVGIVTMDMIMANVTGVACKVGDTATLLGGVTGTGTALDEAAAASGISPYELLVGLKLRLERVYLNAADGAECTGANVPADGATSVHHSGNQADGLPQ